MLYFIVCYSVLCDGEKYSMVLVDRHLKTNSQSRSVCWGHCHTWLQSFIPCKLNPLFRKASIPHSLLFSLHLQTEQIQSPSLITNCRGGKKKSCLGRRKQSVQNDCLMFTWLSVSLMQQCIQFKIKYLGVMLL